MLQRYRNSCGLHLSTYWAWHRRKNHGCKGQHAISYDNRLFHAVIGALIAAGCDMNAHRSSDGQTPFMCTANHWSSTDSFDWTQFADSCDVDHNAQDMDRKTVLHTMLRRKRDTQEVKKWLQSGTNPNMKDCLRRTCLFELCSPWNTGGEYR